MKWDQGLLTLFLIGGVTAITAAACGPSNSGVTVLPLPHGLRQMNICANNIGMRESKAVGTGAVMKAGEAPIVATTTMCKQVYVKGQKQYRWAPEEYGYKLGANDQKQMNIDVAIQIYVVDKNTDQTTALSNTISELCTNQIQALWPTARLGSTLKVSINPYVQDGSFQSRKNSSSSHVLILRGDDASGYVIDHWSDRARLTTVIGADPEYKACMEKNQGDPRTVLVCPDEAFARINASNAPFCAEVAQMVGHYLGLAQGIDKSCDGKEEAAPLPHPAQKVIQPVQTFMRSIGLAGNVGENFWKNVSFTDSDRRIVVDRGCDVPQAAGTQASAGTPVNRSRRGGQAATAQVIAPTNLSTTGSGLAGK